MSSDVSMEPAVSVFTVEVNFSHDSIVCGLKLSAQRISRVSYELRSVCDKTQNTETFAIFWLWNGKSRSVVYHSFTPTFSSSITAVL